MEVRFVVMGPAIDVTYGFGDARVPVAGELISSDWSDPAFPAGLYEVERVTWSIGLRGPNRAICVLT